MEHDYLAHHGIKGMKWGIRRYQNEDGTLTAAGKRRYANNYDYRESDSFKNANARQKAYRTRQYNVNTKMYGKKGANRIEYRVDEEGVKRSKATSKELNRQLVKGLAATVGLYASSYLVGKYAMTGAEWYMKQRLNVKLNNIAVDAYADMAGIGKASGRAGFGTGASAIKTGKAIYDMMMK